MRGFLIFCGLLLGGAATAQVSHFALDNGMEVVVIEDHRAPVVTHMVWYRVGAADEPPGKSGLAHFLEHLMFSGTDEIALGEFSRIIEANGGDDNAFTSYDYTAYHQRVAADRLPLMMQMEADRMTDLVLDDTAFLTERNIVLEERAQRTDSDPGALFREQRVAAQYLNHPYGIPVIGWRHEVEELERADTEVFYRQHYGPNNAILVVAGDVTPEEVRELAEIHYGLIPAIELAPRIRPQEPAQTSARRMTYRDARVRNPYVIRTYFAPERNPGAQRQAAALTLLAEILGGSGATSVLGKALEFDSQIALSTGAFYDGMSVDPTDFGLFIMPVPGVSLQEAEDALDAEVAKFLEEGIEPGRLDRLKAQIHAAVIYDLDDQYSRAQGYGEALSVGLSIEDIESWPDILADITEEEILTAARAVFQIERSVTGWLMGEEAAQ